MSRYTAPQSGALAGRAFTILGSVLLLLLLSFILITGAVGAADEAPPASAARLAPKSSAAAPLGVPQPGPVFTVNTTDGDNDGVCDDTDCSLAEAIQAANNHPNTGAPDEIHFAISEGGVFTITLLDPLPAITEAVIIDGYTEPGAAANSLASGSNAVINIGIDGGLLDPTENALVITASDVTVRGLAIYNVYDYGEERAIRVASGNNAVIEGNFIGVRPNGLIGANSYGLEIIGGSGHRVGGSSPASRNVIAGQANAGLVISGTTGVQILGNMIGTDRTGTYAYGNGTGLYVLGATNTTIGGTVGTTPDGVCSGSCNLISGQGNYGDGVIIDGASAGTQVQGNFIGTTITGTLSLANRYGISMTSSGGAPANTTIGGTTAAARNLLSGNGRYGLAIDGAAVTTTTIQGNYVGTDTTGVAQVGNEWGGIFIVNAKNNTIGGVNTQSSSACTGACNLISGNYGAGIGIDGGANANNIIQGNVIGLAVDGDDELGNLGHGVYVQGTTFAAIGGPNAGEGNIISANGSDYDSGLLIDTVSNLTVQGNRIGVDTTGLLDRGNGRHGIEIWASSFITVGGTINTTPTVGCAGSCNVIAGHSGHGIAIRHNAYGIDLQGNYIGLGGDGQTALGNGNAGVSLGACECLPPQLVRIGGTTASARNVIAASGWDGIYAAGVVTLTVQGNFIGTDKSGTLDRGNSDTGIWIEGAHAVQIGGTTGTTPGGACTGACNLVSGNATQGIYFAGYVSDAQIQGNVIGLDAAGTVALGNDGSGVFIDDWAGGEEPLTATSNILVGGTTAAARNVSSGNGEHGVRVSGFAVSGVGIQGNFIGTDTTGALDLGNTQDGVTISDSSGHLIGGDTGTTPDIECAGACNLISGNGGQGINLRFASDNNTVQGNFIGTDKAGLAALPNSSAGVQIQDFGGLSKAPAPTKPVSPATTSTAPEPTRRKPELTERPEPGFVPPPPPRRSATPPADKTNATGNRIGGTAPAQRNLISGNGGHGIDINSFPAGGNTVQGNYIGTRRTGTTALANGGAGVRIDSADDTVIGGANPGEGNLISGNTSYGIELTNGADNTTIQGNRVGVDKDGAADLGNGASGIRIASSDGAIIGGTDGVTPGGACTGACNLISGNAGDGIWLDDGVDNSTIAGNFIGTNASGTLAIPNDDDGIDIFTPDTKAADGPAARKLANNGITIGGTTPADRNVISGNTANGVRLFGPGTGGNTLQGNYIGVQPDGTGALGNGVNGVLLWKAGGNTVGGSAVGAGNVIAHNGASGVRVLDSLASNNAILGNAIYSNSELGIDLNGDGVTPNEPGDADTGPNQLQNFPTLKQVDVGVDATYLLGAFNSEPNKSYRMEVFASPTCDASGHGEGRTYLGFATLNTNASGDANFFVTLPITATLVGQAITLTATDTATNNTSEFSPCLTADAFNNTWATARPIPLPAPSGSPPSQTGAATRYLILSNQASWFRFNVSPFSQVMVELKGLPADYDLSLHTNPQLVYDRLGAPAPTPLDITQRVAQEGFLQEGFLQEGFLQEGFLQEGFLQEGFLQEGFLQEGFLQEGFLQEGFLQEGFLRSMYLQEGFLQEGFLPPGYGSERYRGAAVLSLFALSANAGTLPERISRNTWGYSGDMFIRVAGRDGAFSQSQPFLVEVTVIPGNCEGVDNISDSIPLPTAAPGDRETLILTDFSQLQLTGTADDKTALLAELETFRARPEVKGVVIDISEEVSPGAPKYPRVKLARDQANAHPDCPAAKNILAEEIRQIVLAYRANNPIKNIVALGGDTTIPFFRYPDQAGLGVESDYYPPVLDNTASQAALRYGQFLSQDAYGTRVFLTRPDHLFPIPDLPVGRLVETMAEIKGMLTAYRDTNGVISPTTSLVTGYDFVTDVANATVQEYQVGLGTTPDTLIQPEGDSPSDPTAWTAQNLRDKLFVNDYDLVFFAGHFSATGAEAADYRSRLTALEFQQAPPNFKNNLIYSVGCHSGYNIVDGHAIPNVTESPDWAQAFARRQVTSVIGTGYQYGDTELIEFSEALYLQFTRNLRTGAGAIPVGKALFDAKREYLSGLVTMRGIHAKSILQATLYGLPAFSVNVPGARLTAPGDTSIANPTPVNTNPGLALGLYSADVVVPSDPPALITNTVTLTNIDTNAPVQTTYFSTTDGVIALPLEPVLPREISNVDFPTAELRGVGWRGGWYIDVPNLVPLTGAPTTELGRTHPAFFSTVFYPSRPWGVNYLDALANGSTRLISISAQFKSNAIGDIQGTFRKYSEMSFRLFYNNNIAAEGSAPPPSIDDVQTVVNGSDIAFTVKVSGEASAGIHAVWILYTDTSQPFPRQWLPVDLTPVAPKRAATANVAQTTWTGNLNVANPGAVRFLVTAVNGVGKTTQSSDFGDLYIPGFVAPTPTVPTQLSVQVPPPAGFRDNVTFTATLTANSSPAPDQTVRLKVGARFFESQTNGSGVATFTFQVTDLPNTYPVQATFEGDATFQPSFATGSFSVVKQGTQLTQSASATGQYSDPPTFEARLTDDTAPTARDIAEKSVFFVVTQSATFIDAVTGISNHEGKAKPGPLQLSSGNYSIRAYFSGSIPIPGQTEPLVDARYDPAVAGASVSLAQTAEDATVSYTGPVTFAFGSPLAVSALVTQANDGFPGDITLARVRFTLKNALSQTVAFTEINALANATAATTFKPQSSGAYTLELQVVGSYFNSPLVTANVTVNSLATPTFVDAPLNHWAWSFIEAIYQAGITTGCITTPPRYYCPISPVAREQMAVFFVRAKYGLAYTPPPATGLFSDVPADYWAAAHIEKAYQDGLVTVCGTGPLRFCPTSSISRDMAAQWLLLAKYGSAYTPPPPPQQLFVDVPLSHPQVAWINQLFLEGITTGCVTSDDPGTRQFCPDTLIDRAQMAVFLGRLFGLPRP